MGSPTGIEDIAPTSANWLGRFSTAFPMSRACDYFGPARRGPSGRRLFRRRRGLSPHEFSAVLETHYGILTRSGIHCAPLAHEAIGTLAAGGTTRLSFGPFLSVQDVQYAADALADIAGQSDGGKPAIAAGSAQQRAE